MTPGDQPNGVECAAATASIVRWEGGATRRMDDAVAVEEPLEIRVRGRAISVTMRTPGHDEELAAGFLLTEGVIRRHEEIEQIDACSSAEAGNTLNVRLAPLVAVDFQRLTRHVFAASSCGVCGKATIDSVRSTLPAITSALRVKVPLLAELPRRMREAQGTFDKTGGLHAAALFDPDGRVLVVREDVGRHNAVDKVLGFALKRAMLPLSSSVIVVSGRASFEIVQKAAAAGVPVVAAVSAPSSLAVEFAREMGQTLVGFLRGQRLNVYTCPERIVAGEPQPEASR
jgi:FdhD protein